MARASSATAQVPLLKSAAGETARCLSVYPTMGQTDGRTDTAAAGLLLCARRANAGSAVTVNVYSLGSYLLTCLSIRN